MSDTCHRGQEDWDVEFRQCLSRRSQELQESQTEAPGDENWFDGQGLHMEDPPLENVPEGHSAQGIPKPRE